MRIWIQFIGHTVHSCHENLIWILLCLRLRLHVCCLATFLHTHWTPSGLHIHLHTFTSEHFVEIFLTVNVFGWAIAIIKLILLLHWLVIVYLGTVDLVSGSQKVFIFEVLSISSLRRMHLRCHMRIVKKLSHQVRDFLELVWHLVDLAVYLAHLELELGLFILDGAPRVPQLRLNALTHLALQIVRNFIWMIDDLTSSLLSLFRTFIAVIFCEKLVVWIESRKAFDEPVCWDLRRVS